MITTCQQIVWHYNWRQCLLYTVCITLYVTNALCQVQCLAVACEGYHLIEHLFDKHINCTYLWSDGLELEWTNITHMATICMSLKLECDQSKSDQHSNQIRMCMEFLGAKYWSAATSPWSNMNGYNVVVNWLWILLKSTLKTPTIISSSVRFASMCQAYSGLTTHCITCSILNPSTYRWWYACIPYYRQTHSVGW